MKTRTIFCGRQIVSTFRKIETDGRRTNTPRVRLLLSFRSLGSAEDNLLPPRLDDTPITHSARLLVL